MWVLPHQTQSAHVIYPRSQVVQNPLNNLNYHGCYYRRANPVTPSSMPMVRTDTTTIPIVF
jgi:hypothetical protein